MTPLTLTANGFAKAVGVSKRTFYRSLISKYKLRPVYLAGIKRWLTEDVERIDRQMKSERDAVGRCVSVREMKMSGWNGQRLRAGVR